MYNTPRQRPCLSGRIARDGCVEILVRPEHPRYLEVLRRVGEGNAAAALQALGGGAAAPDELGALLDAEEGPDGALHFAR